MALMAQRPRLHKVLPDLRKTARVQDTEPDQLCFFHCFITRDRDHQPTRHAPALRPLTGEEKDPELR